MGMSEPGNNKRWLRRRWPLVLTLGLLLGLFGGALALMFSAENLSKADLEQRLRELPKNQALGELARRTLTADLGAGPLEYDLVYHFAGARNQSAPKARPVVLVHGTPSTLFSWTELICGAPESEGRPAFAGLSETRDVYAIEVLGHGIAPDTASPVTFELCARFVAAAIRALGLEDVHLVGSSYGGEFVWRAALNAPELIATVSLLDSSGITRRDADWLSEEVAMRENPLASLGWLLNSRARIEVALAPHFRTIPPDRVEEFYLVCANRQNWSAMVDLARDENGEREGELSDLELPTLLLWGQEDVAYLPDHYAERFAEELPSAELVLLPETGHYPHEERPGATSERLERFFTEQESVR